ncbi:MAG: hypothetical protein ABI769_18200 [Pseudomonadota bacterium]
MTRKLEIEAALERSLRKQVVVPRLDGRFDAAVWSRIEAEDQRASRSARAAAVAPASARWLFAINLVGASFVVVLVLYFGIQSFRGVTVSLPIVSAPEVSATTMDWVSRAGGWCITAASLAFGLMFTSLGRRLRSSLRQFL